MYDLNILKYMEYYQRTSKVLLDSLNFKALVVSHINYLFRLTICCVFHWSNNQLLLLYEHP